MMISNCQKCKSFDFTLTNVVETDNYDCKWLFTEIKCLNCGYSINVRSGLSPNIFKFNSWESSNIIDKEVESNLNKILSMW